LDAGRGGTGPGTAPRLRRIRGPHPARSGAPETWPVRDAARLILAQRGLRPADHGRAQQPAGSFIAEWNVQMAGALLSALPTLLVYVLMGRYFVQGRLAGSIKGEGSISRLDQSSICYPIGLIPRRSVGWPWEVTRMIFRQFLRPETGCASYLFG
jgi:hypothetical protein